jgi:CRISPR/Cas system Type II protein with McrA/HNH and RuvC-like nuclease domain
MMTNGEFWEHELGNAQNAKDFCGRPVRKGDFQKPNSEYGWDRDHILPQSANGPDSIENWQITNVKTNREKADKTTFEANGTLYQVKKTSRAQDDRTASYPYREKKYCIVIQDK